MSGPGPLPVEVGRAGLHIGSGVDADADWIEVFRSPDPRECDERALVLTAVGVPVVMRAEAGAYGLRVDPADAPRAAFEIARYAFENRPRPRAVPFAPHAGAAVGVAGYLLVLLAGWIASSRGLLGVDWFGAGLLDGARFRAGELWRAVTALTLHADLAHLLANAGFGALFGGLAGRVYGAGCGWLLILVAATAANAVNGWTMPASRASLGASTAVFAALGALAVHRWPASTRRMRRGLAGGGLIAALVLLALLGTGDAHTDITAHALGFGFGLALALPLRRWRPPRTAVAQWLAGGGALLLIAVAWASGYWM